MKTDIWCFAVDCNCPCEPCKKYQHCYLRDAKEKSMITLRNILELINFRRIDSELEKSYQENSNTIRIYSDFKDWFEFGIYDFAYEGDREKRVEKILTQELLDSEVSSINTIDGLNLIAIWVENSKSVDN